MSPNLILLALGDEHVHPFKCVWSAPHSEVAASRARPLRCATRNDAIGQAARIAATASSTRDFPWVIDDNGLVLSPAYLRSYAKTMGF